MKVVICVCHQQFELWSAPEWVGPRLGHAFPDLKVVQLPSYERFGEELRDAEVFVGWSMRAEQLLAARKLRWIHSTAAGVAQLLFPELVASDVLLTNSRNVQGPVVAEHVIAQIFALAKRLPSAVRHQSAHHWAQTTMWEEQPPPREVAGSTLALIGFGMIGREVARRARALGMNVVAVREHPERGVAPGMQVAPPWLPTGASADAADSGISVAGFDALDEVLPRADYVVIAAPVTPRTRRLIDAARLARMRKDAYLINVSRGALIDEAALLAGLRERRIAGAALDVFDTEPLPPDSKLWEAPNLLITPHTAAVVVGLWERHYALIAENLQRFLSGRPLLNLVDKQRGY